MAKIVLVVEDDFLIALDLCAAIEQCGHGVLGPVHTADQAQRIVATQQFDAALLDTTLAHGETSEPIADALSKRNIPFIVVSGYERRQLPGALRAAPLVAKPFETAEIVAAVSGLLDGSERGR